MKRRIVDVLIIVIIIGLAFSTYVNGQVVDVDTYQARKGKVTSRVRINGEVYTKTVESIMYSKDCIITEFLVDEGQEIRVGDPVFKLDLNYDLLAVDTEELELQMALEVQKNKLSSLSGSGLTVEWQHVELLKVEMNQLKEDYENDKILFDSGVITKSQLDDSKSKYEQKKLAYDQGKVTYNNKVSSSDIEIQEIQKKIQDIEKQLTYIDIEKNMFSNVDEEGIYYSEHRGVVKNISSIGVILNKKTKLLDIAVTGNVENYKFVGYVDAENNHLILEGDQLDLYDGVIDEPLKGKVLKIYDVVEDGKVQVDVAFLEDRAAKISYGKTFYSEKVIDPISQIVIPKNCVIGHSDMKVGDDVEIFIVDNDHAKKIEVTVENVGDSTIGIVLKEQVELNDIITDPSYKIKDGVKVR